VFIVWIVLFSVVTNIAAFREQLDGSPFLDSAWTLFNDTVRLVMGFYFGSEAAVQVVRLWQGGKTLRTLERLEDPRTEAAEEAAEMSEPTSERRPGT
jgi:hypothetical protein